jgi:hypothetical protein
MTEQRVEPTTGIVWLLVEERRVDVTIRPVGSLRKRRIPLATWRQWELRSGGA